MIAIKAEAMKWHALYGEPLGNVKTGEATAELSESRLRTFHMEFDGDTVKLTLHPHAVDGAPMPPRSTT